MNTVRLDTKDGKDYTVFVIDNMTFYVPSGKIYLVDDVEDMNYLKDLAEYIYCDGQLVKTPEDA